MFFYDYYICSERMNKFNLLPPPYEQWQQTHTFDQLCPKKQGHKVWRQRFFQTFNSSFSL